MSSSGNSTEALSAAAFIGSIGVNTHTGTWDAAYGLPDGSNGDPAKIETELTYLGIDAIRDTLEYAWQLPEYQQLAAAGVKFDLFIGASNNADSLTAQVADIARLAPDVLSVEGPNESDNWPVTYDGTTGLAATSAMQAALYPLVHGTAALAGVPVIESSLGNASSYAALAGLGDADYGNTHSYFFGFTQTIASQIPARIAQEGTVAPGLPTIATEAGWSTADSPAVYGSVDLTTQAKLTLDLLFDQFDAGVSMTYLYQLMDEPELNDSYGLFYADGTAKPVAVALHNLTTILSAGTSGTSVTALGSLAYTVTGMPATGEQSLLEKSNGAYDLVLWNEAPIWNATTDTEIAVAPVPVTVTLGGSFATVTLYDPLQGSTAIEVWHNVSSVQVEVSDHPQIIEISPNPPAPPTITGLTAATDTGLSDSDGITADATPVVTGTAPAGATVTLLDGAVALGTATAGPAAAGGATGAWSIALGTALPSGSTALTATASLAIGGTSAASLPYDVVIETVPPVVTALTTSLAAGSVLLTGQRVTITLTASSPLSVTGTPALLLSNGGTATYDSASSSASALVFDYVAAATQTSSDLLVTGLALDGGSITDAAGNPLNAAGLAGLAGSATGLQVNPDPPSVTVGSGPDTLALSVNEDYYLANAKFTVAVDGTQIGGTLTTTAIRGDGQVQVFDIEGTFGPGQHVVSIDFLNDAYAGTPQTDRNLYVTQASVDGTPLANATLPLMSQGVETFAFGAPVAPLDTLSIGVSEDAWDGNAQFQVTMDGKPVGGVQTATAAHSAGAINVVTLAGSWGLGSHTVGITFINPASSGTTERALYVDSLSYDGVSAAGTPVAMVTNATQTLAVAATPAVGVLTLDMAEDAYEGDAQFSVAIDGQQVGAKQLVSVLNASGKSEAFSFDDVLAAGSHSVAVSFLNDAYGGSPSLDRNLYVKGASFNGTPLTGWTATLDSNGTAHFTLSAAV